MIDSGTLLYIIQITQLLSIIYSCEHCERNVLFTDYLQHNWDERFIAPITLYNEA